MKEERNKGVQGVHPSLTIRMKKILSVLLVITLVSSFFSLNAFIAATGMSEDDPEAVLAQEEVEPQEESVVEVLPQAFTVTFYAEGAWVASASVNEGEAVGDGVVADPVSEGQIFAGWYSDAACTNGFDFYLSEPIYGNKDVFAKFIVEEAGEVVALEAGPIVPLADANWASALSSM